MQVEHLVIVSHGIRARRRSLQYLGRSLQGLVGENGFVHLLQCNEGPERTYEGIDVGGERAVSEICALVVHLRNLKRISFIGHSLGGLYLRYVVGKLFQRHFFDEYEPVNFITLATPHVGSRRGFVGKRVSKLYRWFVAKMFATTAKQLTLEDGPQPLLLQMSLPDSVYVQGLRRFRHLILYATIAGDNIVPYSTAAIVPRNPYKTGERKKILSKKYPHIIDDDAVRTSDRAPDLAPHAVAAAAAAEQQQCDTNSADVAETAETDTATTTTAPPAAAASSAIADLAIAAGETLLSSVVGVGDAVSDALTADKDRSSTGTDSATAESPSSVTPAATAALTVEPTSAATTEDMELSDQPSAQQQQQQPPATAAQPSRRLLDRVMSTRAGGMLKGLVDTVSERISRKQSRSDTSVCKSDVTTGAIATTTSTGSTAAGVASSGVRSHPQTTTSKQLARALDTIGQSVLMSNSTSTPTPIRMPKTQSYALSPLIRAASSENSEEETGGVVTSERLSPAARSFHSRKKAPALMTSSKGTQQQQREIPIAPILQSSGDKLPQHLFQAILTAEPRAPDAKVVRSPTGDSGIVASAIHVSTPAPASPKVPNSAAAVPAGTGTDDSVPPSEPTLATSNSALASVESDFESGSYPQDPFLANAMLRNSGAQSANVSDSEDDEDLLSPREIEAVQQVHTPKKPLKPLRGRLLPDIEFSASAADDDPVAADDSAVTAAPSRRSHSADVGKHRSKHRTIVTPASASPLSAMVDVIGLRQIPKARTVGSGVDCLEPQQGALSSSVPSSIPAPIVTESASAIVGVGGGSAEQRNAAANEELQPYSSDPQMGEVLRQIQANLNTLPWKRVDCCFDELLRGATAHSAIIVRTEFLHGAGKDIIQHLMDHFDLSPAPPAQ